MARCEIDYRWGSGIVENVRKYAAELAALAPDAILAADTPTMALGLPPVPDRSGKCAAHSRPHYDRRPANLCGLFEVVRCLEQRALGEWQAKKLESKREAVA